MLDSIFQVFAAALSSFQVLNSQPSRSKSVDAIAKQSFYLVLCVFLVSYSSCKSFIISILITFVLYRYCILDYGTRKL